MLNEDQKARPPLTADQYHAIQHRLTSSTKEEYLEACVFDIARIKYNEDPANAGKRQDW